MRSITFLSFLAFLIAPFAIHLGELCHPYWISAKTDQSLAIIFPTLIGCGIAGTSLVWKYIYYIDTDEAGEIVSGLMAIVTVVCLGFIPGYTLAPFTNGVSTLLSGWSLFLVVGLIPALLNLNEAIRDSKFSALNDAQERGE